jgi:phosphatidylglycerophosphatase A
MSEVSSQDSSQSPVAHSRARSPAFWLGTFFGSGLSPFMPGTAGSLASLLLWVPIVYVDTPWWGRLLLAVAIFLVGIPISTRCAEILDNEDPKEVVIDEVAGQGVAVVLCAAHPASLAAAFVLFRIFDIAKPWPVGWADKKLHGGLGIMVDDMLAGGFALGCLWLVERYAWPALGIGA